MTRNFNKFNKSEKYVFLIGGHDLEMQEIIKILEECNCKYIDEGLKWGANLSSYKKYFKNKEFNEKIFVGLELLKDCELPKNYIEINHHDKKRKLPSSIKQVACLLSIKLNRKQLLISANDGGYIQCLIEQKATDEEIIEIRSEDRKAQGVTKEDELKANESIKNYSEFKDNFLTIQSLTDRFSAVSDALYIDEDAKKINKENFEKYKRLIIYNDNSLNYYGDSIPILEKEIIPNEHLYVYSGGQDSQGYFGIVFKTPNIDESRDMVKKIKEIMLKETNIQNDSPLYSYHIFMLPFRFETKEKQKNYKSVDLNEIEKIFNSNNLKTTSDWKGWIRFSQSDCDESKVKDIEDSYNERVYFYDFARKALFDDCKCDEKDPILMEFYIDLRKEYLNTYTINLKSSKSYSLKIESVNVVFYNTNVGVLSFKLINDEYDNFDDILKINDFGRRIYPQYLSADESKNTYSLDNVKNSFLADSITVNINGNCICDTFERFSDVKFAEFWKDPSNDQNLIPKYIKDIFPESFLGDTGNYKILPIVDDRMFVMSWYANDGLIESLKHIECDYGEYFYNYCINEDWYKYVFVDNDAVTNENYFFRKEELTKSTYGRWIDQGSLFGITNYSFVFLGKNEWFQKNVILKHIKTMYYRIAFLSLAQKATFLHFSERINEIDDSEAIGLHKKYLDFMNNVYFNEVTAQVQGIDLYNMLNEKMNLKERVRELQRDFKELSMNLELDFGHKLNVNVLILTIMSLLLLSLSTISTVMSLNSTYKTILSNITFFVVFIVFLCIVYIIFQNDKIKKIFCFLKNINFKIYILIPLFLKKIKWSFNCNGRK